MVAAINVAETLQVDFADERLTVFFLLIASVPASEVKSDFEWLGNLKETDSIDVLNHIVDILAYNPPD